MGLSFITTPLYLQFIFLTFYIVVDTITDVPHLPPSLF